MQILTEKTFDGINSFSTINESTNEKQWFVEGVYAQAVKQNRNHRVYPLAILEREINRYVDEYVNTNRALGELNHAETPQPDPAMASHRIVEMRQDGNDFYGKSLVLDTPRGNILRGLLSGGTQMGMSTRAAGTLKEGVVQNDLKIFCVDAVSDPSGIDCFVNGILEGVEWCWEGGRLVEKAATQAKTEINKMKNVNEAKLLAVFESFMGKL